MATLALGVGLLPASLVHGAPAAVPLRPPAGIPDPKPMVLTASDLGRGARVTSQRYYRDTDFPSVISYERELESGRVGSTDLPYVDSQAEIGTSARSTASFLGTLKRVLGTKQGRALVTSGFAGELPTGGLVSNVRVGRPRGLGVGAGSFDLPLTVRVLGLRTEAHFAAFRVDRVLGVLVAVGDPGRRVSRGVMTRLARIMAGRMTAELSPRNITLPVISGTPRVGETLTTTEGTWKGGPSRFTYQWLRCDSAGANCADVASATGPTYLLADGDVGSTMRVAVIAQNTIGAATAISAPTTVVSALGAPISTSPPTISGTPQVGQTLTAGTGSWTGSPTSFSFQWQRCDSSGTSCIDLPGATAGTYVPSSADVGSTLRVTVTARNSVGAATAVSAPSPVVAA